MKNHIAIFILAFAFLCGLASPGPAPNSGDGIPDGSGLDKAGAPNSGDGIPDGSGF